MGAIVHYCQTKGDKGRKKSHPNPNNRSVINSTINTKLEQQINKKKHIENTNNGTGPIRILKV